MDHVRRRLTLGLAASALLPPVAFGQAPIKLSLAHNSPPSSPKGMGATKFAELVAAKTNGRIAIHVAPSEQLGNENTKMGALRTGTLDFGCLGQGATAFGGAGGRGDRPAVSFSNLPDAWAALDGPVGQRLGKKHGIQEPRVPRMALQRHSPNDQQQAADHQAGRLKGLKIRTPLDSGNRRYVCGDGRHSAADQLGRSLPGLAERRRRRAGEPVGEHLRRQTLRGAEVRLFHQPQVRGDGAGDERGDLGSPGGGATARSSRRRQPKSAPYQRKLMADSEEKLGGEFKKMASLQMNTVDTAPFRQATERVWDQWEKKPFGDFVKLRCAHCASRRWHLVLPDAGSRRLIDDVRTNRGKRMAWRPRVLSIARGGGPRSRARLQFPAADAGLGLLCLLTVVVVLRYAFADGFRHSRRISPSFCSRSSSWRASLSPPGAACTSQRNSCCIRCRRRGVWRLQSLIHVVTAIDLLLLAWYALQNAIIAHDQTSPVMEIPWSVGYGCLALGLALVATCSLTAIVRHTLGGEAVKVDLADAGAAVT